MNLRLNGPLRAAIAAALACLIYGSDAMANLTIDLRATGVSGGGMLGDSKSVFGVVPGSAITLEVWAAIDSVGSIQTRDTFGLQRVMGSIISAPLEATPTLRGRMSPMNLLAPFNAVLSTAGVVQELSTPADGSLDLGSNATSHTPQFIFFRSNIGSTGERLNAQGAHFITNNIPAGATFRPIPNGYEFLLGEAEFGVQDVFDPTGDGLSLNWVIPPFTAFVSQAMRASWTHGDGAIYNGSTQAALMFTGAPVKISTFANPAVVPEVANWNLLAGFIGLLASGRRAGRGCSRK